MSMTGGLDHSASRLRDSTARPKPLKLGQAACYDSPRRSISSGPRSPSSLSGLSAPASPVAGPRHELPQGSAQHSAAGPLLLAAHAAVASSLRHPSPHVRLQALKYTLALAQVTSAGVAHSTVAVYLQLGAVDHSQDVRVLTAQLLPVWATQVLHGFAKQVKGVELCRKAAALTLPLFAAALVDPCRGVRQSMLRAAHVWLPCVAALKRRSTADMSGDEVLHILLPYLRFALGGGLFERDEAVDCATDWRAMNSCLAGLRQGVSLCQKSELHDLLVYLTQHCLSWDGCAVSFTDRQVPASTMTVSTRNSSAVSTPRHHDEALSTLSCLDSLPSISGISMSGSKSPRSLAHTLGAAAAAAVATSQGSFSLPSSHMAIPHTASLPADLTLHPEPKPVFPVPAGVAAATNLVWLWRFAPTARSRNAAHAGIMRGLAASSFARRRSLLPVCLLVSLRVFSRRAVKIELLPLVLLQATADHVPAVRCLAFKCLFCAIACFTEASDTDAIARIGDAALTSLLQRPVADFDPTAALPPSARHLIMWQCAVAACVLQHTAARTVLQALWARRASDTSLSQPPHSTTAACNGPGRSGISVITTATNSVPRHPVRSAHTTPVARLAKLSARKAATPTGTSTGGIASAAAGSGSTKGSSAPPLSTLLLPSRRSPALLKRRGVAVSTSAVRALRSGGSTPVARNATHAAAAKGTAAALPQASASTPAGTSSAKALGAVEAPEAAAQARWARLLAAATQGIPAQHWLRELPPGALLAIQDLVPLFDVLAAGRGGRSASSGSGSGGGGGGGVHPPLRRPRRSSSSVTAAVLASDKFIQAESQRAAAHVQGVCVLPDLPGSSAGGLGAGGVPTAALGQLGQSLVRPFWPWAEVWSPGELLVGEGFLPPQPTTFQGVSPVTAGGGAVSPSALLPTEHVSPPFSRIECSALADASEPILVTGALSSAACICSRAEEGVVLGSGVGADLKLTADRLVARKGGTGSMRSLLSVSPMSGDAAGTTSASGGAAGQWLPHLLHWVEDGGAHSIRAAHKLVASGSMFMHDAAAISALPGAKLPALFRSGVPVMGSAAHTAEVEQTRQASEAVLREAATAEEDALRRIAVEGRRRLELLRRHKELPATRPAGGTTALVHTSPSSSIPVEFPPINSASLSGI